MRYLFLIIILFIPITSVAHPHVFIDTRVSVLFNEKGLTCFKIEWTFDEMFSSTLIQDFDINLDGKFNVKEIKKIESVILSNLKEYDWFTHITINDKQFTIKEINGFYASIDSGVVFYEFFLPCEVTAVERDREVKIAIYDPTYFVQILWASETPFCFKDTSNILLNYEVFEDEGNSYYYGQIIPEALKIKFRKKE
jgi:ABC-type uncharacterized transport system substrate-binding protein